MNNFVITQHQKGSVIILDLKGSLIIGEDNNSKLHNILRILVEKGEKKILLNMIEVPLIDSRGLGELIACHATLQKCRGELKLLHLSDRVNKLMIITKLTAIFEIYGNKEQAIESFNSSPSKIEFPKAVNVREPINKPISLL